MNASILEQTAQDVLASAIIGADWLPHLEKMAEQANVVGAGPARTLPPTMFAVPTSGLCDAFSDLSKGGYPPISVADVMPAEPRDGFVADYQVPLHAARQRSPFFSEFLRPRRLCHQAVAFLDNTAIGNVRFMMFRTEKQGRFEADELRTFSRVLPYLRSAAMILRSSLQAMARRSAEPFEKRGEPVFYLDVDGRLAELNAAAETALGEHVAVVRRRLVASWPPDQARLDSALTAALVEERPGLVTLRGAEHCKSVMALVLPVAGRAKDVFHATSAFVVLIDPARRHTADEKAIGLLNQAAGLTGREVEVVRLVGMGRSPKHAADELGIRYGTLRNHLKAGFAKLGVHTQGELVALIQRLR